MLKRPFEYLNDWYKSKVERDNKNVEYVHTQADGIITWLIGFSVTGFLLVVANLEKLGNKAPTKSILVFLFLTISLGLVFRYISYLITILHRSAQEYFVFTLATDDMTPIIEIENIDELSFDELLILLKIEFNETLDYSYPIPENLKITETPKLKKYYRHLISISKKEFDHAIDFLTDLDEEVYKIKKEDTIKKIDSALQSSTNKVGYNLKRWNITRSLLYLSCLLSFLTAITILFVSLMLYL